MGEVLRVEMHRMRVECVEAARHHRWGFARIQEGTRAIAGLPAPWILYVHRTDPGDLRAQVWQFFFVRESRGYIVTCTAAPVHFESFRADFEEAVDSFKLE